MNAGESINNRYKILNCLSDSGGMGCVMIAKDSSNDCEVALKYFRHTSDASLKERFRREVRLMQNMEGSERVVSVLDADLDHDPPFFVMPIYSKGDLSTISAEISTDFDLQRSVLLSMCDAVQALHEQGHFHRDIKPANFLRDAEGVIVISDLGFALDPSSSTRQTLSQQGWGTEGYTPPEFREVGGFKSASEASDIFMLGRSFYQVLSGRDPLFVDPSAVEKPLYFVIDRCCKLAPAQRFASISEVKVALNRAFDHLTGNLDSVSKAKSKFETIQSRLQSRQYKRDEVKGFLEDSLSLDPSELFGVIGGAEPTFFSSISQKVFSGILYDFLKAYETALDSASGLGFGYAETVANNMKRVFMISGDEESRLFALNLAIDWAEKMHRFAAMSTCNDLITEIKENDSIAHGVVAIIADRRETFVSSIEPKECSNSLVANCLRELNKS